ncbi:hypothetical protein M758_UG192900 [Ceratodon purpureus]|nr:hypothetical protein M758_UG192900 [Ceratodon purpureus]
MDGEILQFVHPDEEVVPIGLYYDAEVVVASKFDRLLHIKDVFHLHRHLTLVAGRTFSCRHPPNSRSACCRRYLLSGRSLDASSLNIDCMNSRTEPASEFKLALSAAQAERLAFI